MQFRLILLCLTCWLALFTTGAGYTAAWLIRLVTVPGLERSLALFGLELFTGLTLLGVAVLGAATLALAWATIRPHKSSPGPISA